MILWPIVLTLSWSPATNFFIRILSTFVMTDVTPQVQVPTPLPPSTTSTIEPKLSNLISGIYDYQSSVNFDNYLKQLGVNYVLRKLAALASPTVTIGTNCQDHELHDKECIWSIKTDTVFRSHSVSFKLNQKSKDVTMDGRDVEFSIYQPKSNQWVEEQHDVNQNLTTTITRDFKSDQMRVGLLVQGITAASIFKRRKTQPEDQID